MGPIVVKGAFRYAEHGGDVSVVGIRTARGAYSQSGRGVVVSEITLRTGRHA